MSLKSSLWYIFQAEVAEKLAHMRSMMTYLEASRFKALNVMMDLESRPRVSHSLSSYIDYSKDKQGLTAATLKIPAWVKPEPLPPTPQIDLPPIPGEKRVNNFIKELKVALIAW